MGKPFFTSWAIWEKLVFCLACAIVVTVLAGAIKLAYTHWRLRKFAAVAESEKQEQALHRQMSQRRPRTETHGNDDVPFGIRAIESGIEVDGVWISRPNTPDSMDKQSSSAWEQAADLEKQLPQRHSRPISISGSSLSATSRPTSSSQDRAASVDKVASAQTSRESSPDAYTTKPARTQYPPCSYSKYSNVIHQPKPAPTVSTSEGIEAIRRASTSISADMVSSGSSESDQSGHDVESIAASAPRLFTPDATPRPRHHSVDLELLNSHRVSQAAEIGQLMPRPRKPGSRDSSSTNLPTPVVGANEGSSEYFTPRQRAPSTPSAGSSSTNPFSTPTVDTLPPQIRRSSMPDVTPFAEFCQNASRSPRPNGYRSSSAESTTRARQPSDLSLYTTVPAASPPLTPGAPPLPPPPPPPPQRPKRSPPNTETEKQPHAPLPFENRSSQILRGHGTGFEVLRPGTFELPPPPDTLSAVLQSQRQSRASVGGPPVSLQNIGGGGKRHSRSRGRSADSGGSGGRRKLQKKRRPSQDSGHSSDTTG